MSRNVTVLDRPAERWLRALVDMRALSLCFVLFVTGCGYRFTAGGAPLPDGVRTVHVPVFLNRTSETGVEAVFTEQLRQRCMRAGVLGGEASDARIEGEVRGVYGAPTILDTVTTGRLASYRMYGSAMLRLVKGGVVLREIEISGQEDYLPRVEVRAGEDAEGNPAFKDVEGDPLLTDAQRTAAVRRLAEALMRDGYEQLTTGW